MWVILDKEGNCLGSYETSEDAYEATYQDIYPENVEVAYIEEG